jgi:hypothetical protein
VLELSLNLRGLSWLLQLLHHMRRLLMAGLVILRTWDVMLGCMVL